MLKTMVSGTENNVKSAWQLNIYGDALERKQITFIRRLIRLFLSAPKHVCHLHRHMGPVKFVYRMADACQLPE